ncbi:MAG: polysaccharide biosynthesis tyrosine autokinase [Thermosynechococcaceae cyanobacterium]
MSGIIVKPENTDVKEQDWGYGHLLAILFRRRLWFLGTLAAVLCATIILTIRSKPLYQSAMRILVESNYRARPQQSGQATTKDEITDSNLQVDTNTQIQVLRSSKLLQQAVDLLQQDYRDMSVEELQLALDVSPVYGVDRTGEGKVATSVLSSSYVGDDPAKTQRVLQTLLSVYQVYNLEQQKLRLSKGLAFIDSQLPKIRKSVQEAETALQTFRRGENVIDPSEQAGVVAAQLAEIQRERESLKAQYREAFASYQTLQRQINLSPSQAIESTKLTESPRYQALLNRIQATELELAQQQQQLTSDHPTIQDLKKQLQDQQALLAQEEGRVLGPGASSSSDLTLLKGQLGSTGVDLSKQLTQAQNSLAGLNARDKSLAQTEAKLEADIKQFPQLIAEYSRLQPEVSIRQATLQKLLDARQELSLDIARGAFEWQIVEAPKLGEQISPNIARNILLGTVVGLFLGSVAVLIRESLDDTVHTSEDLGEHIPLPLLGTLPELTQADAREALAALPFYQKGVQELSTPDLFQWKPLREALDLIYANIQLLKGPTASYKSLMVTSALAGEGKSTLSLGLAISASRLDQRILIIDADLRSPSLHHTFNLSNDQGLSTLLTGDISRSEWQSVPQWVYMRWDDADSAVEGLPSSSLRQLPPSDLSLDVLTSGPMVADPVKFLSLERMKEVITAFEESYDLIIVDSPPVLGLVDAIPVGLGCDGVVMVGRMDKITRTELNNAVDILKKLNLIGLVANGVSQPKRNYRYLKA